MPAIVSASSLAGTQTEIVRGALAGCQILRPELAVVEVPTVR